MDDVNVKIISGAFKGIEGTVERFETGSPNRIIEVEIRVDYKNTITVNSDQIESLEEEYLITITNVDPHKRGEKETLAELYIPYVTKICKASLGGYLRNIFAEINPETATNIYGYIFDNYRYRITATLLSEVKTDFKINGVEIDTRSLEHIIDKL